MDFFASREDKPRWFSEEFPDIVKSAKSILDVGCDKKQLSKIFAEGVLYTGLDVSEEADIYFNLDSGKPLPFRNKEYDVVVCLEVLEHLEQIHFVFDEICRVAKRYIIVTLPNPLARIFNSYIFSRSPAINTKAQKYFGTNMKFYGLPLEYPSDRHRWFFNTKESLDFIRYRSNLNNCKLCKASYSFDRQPWPKKWLKYALSGFNKNRAYNFFNITTSFLIEKNK